MIPYLAYYLTKCEFIFEPSGCLLALFFLFRRGCSRSYLSLTLLLATKGFLCASAGLLMTPHLLPVTEREAYNTYFYVYWVCYSAETVFGLALIYQLFRLAMKPLEGIRDIGNVIFRWVGGVSLLLAFAASFSPNTSGSDFWVHLITQFQRTESLLTLCLLLFVSVTLRPLGLTVKSRIFGVLLGLGVLATTNLVEAAWSPKSGSLYSLTSIFSNVAVILALGIWTIYFAKAEPERRIILLPTTSPFHHWNEISEVLGDEPGFVALGKFTADMFAPAELEMMRRAEEQMQKAS